MGFLDRALSGCVVISLISLLGIVAFKFAGPPPGGFFSEFYVLGQHGTLHEYPRRMAAGEKASIRVGVTNKERKATNYTIAAVIGETTVGKAADVKLSPGDNWQGSLALVPPKPGRDQRLELLLFRSNETRPYLRLCIWIDVLP